jgi:hypothetical protein
VKEKRMMTTKDYNEVPEGSSIIVTKEYKTTIHGIWTSMEGTYKVIIPRKYFEKI